MKSGIFKYFLLIALAAQFHLISSNDTEKPPYLHDCNPTDNNFIPNFRFNFTSQPTILDNILVSFLGEIGKYNYRINGTIGSQLDFHQRVKFSFEYLRQRLAYRFSTGTHNQWVLQGAFGAAYQYQIEDYWLTSMEFSAYYSFAPSHHLHRIQFSDDTLTVFRNIAGSDAFGLKIGGSMEPWCLANLTVAVDYDNVKYRKKYSHEHYVAGLGGVVELNQCLPYGFNFDAVAEIRRPFNYYRALLNWTTAMKCGFAGIGVFGSHTEGKRYHLPNNTTAGIEISYSFGNPSVCTDLYCSDTYNENCMYGYNECGDLNPCLTAWVRQPAVYMPQVLAVPDELIHAAPIENNEIPDLTVPLEEKAYAYNVALFFRSTTQYPITFSAQGLPPASKIDPATGIISGTNLKNGEEYFITVTAKANYAIATRTFKLRFIVIPPTSTSIPNRTFQVKKPFKYNVSKYFSSPMHLPFTYVAVGLPDSVSINEETGVIKGIAPARKGSYKVTVMGITNGASITEEFNLIFD